MKIELAPTTQDDLREIGEDQIAFRIRAVTGRIGEKIVLIGGFGFLGHGTVLAFANLTEEAREHPVQLHRGALRQIEAIKRLGGRKIIATADASVDASRRWLEHLGFKPEMMEGKEVWVHQ